MALKILVDEHIPEAVVNSLREEGHAVKRVKKGNSDQNILTQAKDGRRTLVTVDTDFRKLAQSNGAPPKGVILFTQIDGMKTSELTKFMVEEVVKNQNPGAKLYEVMGKKQSRTTKISGSKRSNSATTQESPIAVATIKTLPEGRFKSTHCKAIVAKQFPSHPMAKMTDAAFGTAFLKSIWPLMERMGVRLAKRKPRRYEITSAAKRSVVS